MHSLPIQTKPIAKDFKRIIGTFEGSSKGPTLVFTAGIHGNEPTGVFALTEVLNQLKGKENEFSGKLIALAGNLEALRLQVRFLDTDLNRLFTLSKIQEFKNGKTPISIEEKEQVALLQEIETILSNETGPFYFFDLHTTSSETSPFLTVNDSLLNRKFTKQYPLPIVLGIEEYLDGPLLSYINELGYVAFGFEAGQHTATKSLENHVAFIYASLKYTGALAEMNEVCEKSIKKLGRFTVENHQFYEIIYRYQIEENSDFIMNGNYKNFQRIKKHEFLARKNSLAVNSQHSGYIFMPLYQGKGNDGYFIIRKIPKIFLILSKWLRNVSLDHFLVFLPGIHWKDNNKEALIVNLFIARFFAKQFFHLLGYRNQKKGSSHLVLYNREKASKKTLYQTTKWYRSS
ncbi:MAG: succinylglutamate desuccinylase/aspartoacylase family protein [Flavobacteriaceae bacterium]